MNMTQARVLELLAASPAAVSGESMSRTLGITRAAVAKAVAALRELGYVIESSPRVGHRLVVRPDRLLPIEVTSGLRTRRLGHAVHAFEEVASTQDIARGLLDQGAPDGTLVVAEEQASGRGRIGRAYVCPPGGIWCTLILRGPLAVSVAPLTSLAAGVAAARAIDDVAGLRTTLKWPNDVLLDGRKVVGILTEAMAEDQAVHYLLLGTGINVNFEPGLFPPDVRQTATTLSAAVGRPVDRRALLQRYLLELEQLWDELLAGRSAPVIDAWRGHNSVIGQRVRVQLWGEAIEGVAADLDDDGALVINRGEGRLERVTAGDVRSLPELIDAT